MIYEYRVLRDCWERRINEERLNAMGGEGWRLIYIIERFGAFLFYFERVKPEQEE